MSATTTLADFPRETIATDGHSTCLWHRQSEWLKSNRHLWVKACDICGGDIFDGGARHELCRARAARGVATPRLDQTRKCPCRKCATGGT